MFNRSYICTDQYTGIQLQCISESPAEAAKLFVENILFLSGISRRVPPYTSHRTVLVEYCSIVDNSEKKVWLDVVTDVTIEHVVKKSINQEQKVNENI
jgi:hypothetical protein